MSRQDIEWFSYTEPQMRERERALKQLIGSGMLSGDEKQVAVGLLKKFQESPKSGQERAQVYVDKASSEMLQNLDSSIFESKQK